MSKRLVNLVGLTVRRDTLVSLFAATMTVMALPHGASSDDQSLGVPGVRGGVVTTSEPAAALAGAQVLRDGGNAIDAAVVAQLVLNVVEPQSSGIGGGGFMMIHLAKTGKTFVVDSREEAPAAADPRMFEDPANPGNPVGFSTRSTSGYAVGVPGTLRGVETALKKWGTISLSDALQPAIDIAKNGFLVTSRLGDSLAGAYDGGRLDNERGDPAYDEARGLYDDAMGDPLGEGELLVLPDLARTFELIAAKGAKVFYECASGGPDDLAQAIVDTQKATRSSNPSGVGRMTCADLAQYQPRISQPVEGDYRGFRIVSMPPPSSGGQTVIYIMKLLRQFPLDDASQGFGFGSTSTLHVMIEAMRLAFADRAVWMGDAEFVDLPVNGVISDGYLATRAPLIDVNRRLTDAEVGPGDPRPFDDASLEPATKFALLNLPDEEGLNTTHFSVVDRHGNIVTYTSTIESGFGTGLAVPKFGFLLNNELTDFNSLPTANDDPFNPGANDVAPKKRPRSSMAPTMIFKDDEPLAAFGSPGGSTIIDTVVNVALNLIDHKMTVREAVDAPRVAQTSATGRFATPRREIGFSLDAIQGLEDLGHDPRFPSVLGSVQAVIVDQEDDGKFYGAADRRRIGGIVNIRANDSDDDDDDDDGDDDD